MCGRAPDGLARAMAQRRRRQLGYGDNTAGMIGTAKLNSISLHASAQLHSRCCRQQQQRTSKWNPSYAEVAADGMQLVRCSLNATPKYVGGIRREA